MNLNNCRKCASTVRETVLKENNFDYIILESNKLYLNERVKMNVINIETQMSLTYKLS